MSTPFVCCFLDEQAQYPSQEGLGASEPLPNFLPASDFASLYEAIFINYVAVLESVRTKL